MMKKMATAKEEEREGEPPQTVFFFLLDLPLTFRHRVLHFQNFPVKFNFT